MNQPYPGGGLQVQGDPGLPQTTQEQIHSAWDTYDEVSMQLSLMGFDELPVPPFPKPDVTPEQYTQVEGTEYSLLMARVDRWFEYAGNVKSQLDGRLIAIKNEMDIIAVDYRTQTRANCEATKTKRLLPEGEPADTHRQGQEVQGGGQDLHRPGLPTSPRLLQLH